MNNLSDANYSRRRWSRIFNELATESSNPRDFVSAGNLTYFVADSELGSELWKTDGTTKGTSVVRDIEPGAAGSYPHGVVPMGGLLLFHVGNQAWRTDGTEEGTYALEGLEKIIAVNDSVALADNNMITDGTNEGTKLVTEADGSRFRRGDLIEQIIPKDNEFFVQATRNYRIDNAGIASNLDTQRRSVLMDAADTILAVEGNQLRNIESTEAFVEIHGKAFEGDDWINANGLGYFQTMDGATLLVWRTDGTGTGTFVVASFAQAERDPTSALAAAIVADGESIFFVAEDDHGAELWHSDGTQEGTARVRDIRGGSGSSHPDSLFFEDGQLFFCRRRWHQRSTALDERRYG